MQAAVDTVCINGCKESIYVIDLVDIYVYFKVLFVIQDGGSPESFGFGIIAFVALSATGDHEK